jgi:hypothetical protein
VPAPEVHHEGAEPTGARTGGIQALFSGRAAAHFEEAAGDAELVGQIRIGRFLLDAEVLGLEAAAAQRIVERARRLGRGVAILKVASMAGLEAAGSRESVLAGTATRLSDKAAMRPRSCATPCARARTPSGKP